MSILGKLKKKVESAKTDVATKKVAVAGIGTGGTLGFNILVKPLISEKSATLQGKGVYTFIVNKNANKRQVADAVKDVYGVMPVTVRMVNILGKTTRGKNGGEGKRSDLKKAYVVLPAGKSIVIHENV